MFPLGQGLIISDDIAQIGDALITLVRHEVAKEKPEHESRRRLERFVIDAQQIVARLAERQEGLAKVTDTSLQMLATRAQQAASEIRAIVAQHTASETRQSQKVSEAESRLKADLALLHAALDAERGLRQELVQTVDQLTIRLHALETHRWWHWFWKRS